MRPLRNNFRHGYLMYAKTDEAAASFLGVVAVGLSSQAVVGEVPYLEGTSW